VKFADTSHSPAFESGEDCEEDNEETLLDQAINLNAIGQAPFLGKKTQGHAEIHVTDDGPAKLKPFKAH